MADENTPATESTQTPAAGTTEAPPAEETSGASSLEEVEAYWRKRMSNSDKAHAAERRVLEEKLAGMVSQPSGATGEGGSEVQPQLFKELTQRLEQAEARAQAAELKAKYPTAVEAIGEAARYMDEARLAALNESLNFDASRPTRLDQNNPARRSTTPTNPEDMSLEELTAYVKTLEFPRNQ